MYSCDGKANSTQDIFLIITNAENSCDGYIYGNIL